MGIFFGGGGIFCGTLSFFFLGKQHVPYILDGFRAISLGFPKKTLIPFFFLKRTKRRKEGRKQESKETRKEEGRKKTRKQERRKEGKKEGKKEGRKAQCNPHSRVRICGQEPFLAGPTIAREHRGQRFAALSGNGETLQDRPHIGCWVDRHSFKNEAALAAEGRTSAKKLLEWGLHKRHVDARGNVWVLIPSSKLKVDWARSPPATPKKKT